MADTPRQSLGDEYKKYFQISPALDEDSINDAFFIRHEVYAKDLGFEDTRTDKRETDEYDRHSLQCVVRTIQDPPGLVGCTRLVLTDPLNRDAPLPFEEYCNPSLHRHVIDPAKLPRDRIAEVSRLALMSTFRRRKGEQNQAAPISDGDFGDDQQPRFPFIPISLYFGAVLLARRLGIDYLFMLTVTRLEAHFGKIGLMVSPIGEEVEHRGMRVPSVFYVETAYQNLRTLVRPLWHEIDGQLAQAYGDGVLQTRPDELARVARGDSASA